jgi:hypothetical protein
MSATLALVRRHPLTTFFVLAYALSWWAWILYRLGLFPNPVASFGPFLAAIVVLALTEGKAGILGLFRRMVRWRVAPGWYAVALLLPVVLAAAATALNVLLGAEPPSAAALNAWPGIFSTFAIILLIPGVGGAWEEPGWRGYAVPRLQSGRSALVASLILAGADHRRVRDHRCHDGDQHGAGTPIVPHCPPCRRRGVPRRLRASRRDHYSSSVVALVVRRAAHRDFPIGPFRECDLRCC